MLSISDQSLAQSELESGLSTAAILRMSNFEVVYPLSLWENLKKKAGTLKKCWYHWFYMVLSSINGNTMGLKSSNGDVIAI